MLLENLVVDYPYEDALCMFRTKTENPEFYERIVGRKTGHPYYRFITSGLSDDAFRTALDLAVIFKTVHVHPIDLPVYETKEILSVTPRNNRLSSFMSEANSNDRSDKTFQALLGNF